jgi:hypothetical protein
MKPSLTDYAGELQMKVGLRITDRESQPCGGCFAIAATATDIPFSFAVPCTLTPDPDVGSTCAINTTVDALMPNTVKEDQRATWGLGQVEVYDGGPDGVATTADNTLFAVQGLFAP